MLQDGLVILAVGGLAVLLPLSRTYRSALGRRLTTKAGATVPPGQAAALESRLTRRAIAMGAAILLAGLGILLLRAVWPAGEEQVSGFAILSVLFVFGAAGLVLADLRWPGTTSEGTRTARATSPTVQDYLPPRLLVAGRVFVGVGLLALVVTLALSVSQWFDAAAIWRSPVPLLAGAIPVLLLLSSLATRRILDTPEPARDEAELYWQDAVRAQTLSSLSVTTPFVALFAVVVCGSVLDEAASTAAMAAGQVAPEWTLGLLVLGYLLPVVLVVGTALATVAQRGTWSEMRHFQDRLWDGQPPHAGAEEAHA